MPYDPDSEGMEVDFYSVTLAFKKETPLFWRFATKEHAQEFALMKMSKFTEKEIEENEFYSDFPIVRVSTIYREKVSN